ncbi:carboxynorspermidine decarboxylase [Hydrogenimonas thermophila]|uniref:Carboxynorspermidine/carboxyspermidine decarboxylase n=1 Tax=Hydrogenimonas thermophila TaxID=223786 RepID=A0A1I5NUE0_9BACT|nr:carboxynorspermidine decarboxylase [Hydrogenimonas thermophila]SFP25382.1 carboxynorspermidine decarboxylase [Hydrogenimonas thermophila]
MIDFSKVPTPCYVCEEELLERNLKILDRVQKESGAKILLALKGFAMWSTFDLVGKYLCGTSASGLHEAKLGREEMNKEVHTYSPVFKEEEIEEIARLSDHIVFNSPEQIRRFLKKSKAVNPSISCGLRVNPEFSSAPVDLYNPCGLYSRLGTTIANFDPEILEELDGLHFHALCEQNVDALEGVLKAFEEKFGKFISKMKWINFGGGHHITRKDYDVDRLIEVIRDFKARYNNITVYLEPGEAVGWQTGPLVASVLDIIYNGMDIAILDVSAEAHMPDTLAMPYRAEVRGAGEAGEKSYTYRLGGNTCLAGDIMGDYSFDKPLKVGDKIVFEDQIHYTMVKTTTFNGVQHPSIAIWTKENELKIVREFSYEDFKNRLS